MSDRQVDPFLYPRTQTCTKYPLCATPCTGHWGIGLSKPERVPALTALGARRGRVRLGGCCSTKLSLHLEVTIHTPQMVNSLFLQTSRTGSVQRQAPTVRRTRCCVPWETRNRPSVCEHPRFLPRPRRCSKPSAEQSSSGLSTRDPAARQRRVWRGNQAHRDG